MSRTELLWAPWRSKFLYRSVRGGERCVFCVAGASKADRQHHVVARGRAVFALLNLYPYNNGHFMVAPYRHIGALERLEPAEWAGMLEVLRGVVGRLKRAVRPQGLNVGINLGRVAGAGIPGHLHLHAVPRWRGDSNFMPLLGGARVISQSLDELYTLLTNGTRRRRR